MTAKTETELQEALHAMIETLIDARAGADDEELAEIDDHTSGADGTRSVSTFSERGVLTTDAGLVLTMEDGTEFQLTIVRSR